MRISDIPYLDLAGDDGMSRKKIQHSWNLHLYILISFDMYIVRLLPLFFFSSVQFFRAGIMCFMSHFQRNGKHQIFISSSLPLVSWTLAVFAKFFFLLIILIGFFFNDLFIYFVDRECIYHMVRWCICFCVTV